MRFLDFAEVLEIHDRMIAVGGGRSGILDFTLLHSAIERPKAHFGGVFLYPSVWMMAAALMHSLVKNHPFDDGNKRTAYFTTKHFLEKNGYLLSAENQDGIQFMIAVDVKKLSLEQIASWLKKHSKKIKS